MTGRLFFTNSKDDWSVFGVWSSVFCLSLLFSAIVILVSPTSRGLVLNSGGAASSKGIPLVSLDKMVKVTESEDYIIFDARKPSDYEAGHLPKALSFPNESRNESLKDWAMILQPDQKVLVYCSSRKCDDALQLALFLREFGVAQVELFAEGIEGWKNAGLILENE